MRKKEDKNISKTVSMPPHVWKQIEMIVGKDQAPSVSEYIRQAILHFQRKDEAINDSTARKIAALVMKYLKSKMGA